MRFQVEMRHKDGPVSEPVSVDVPVAPSGRILGVVLDALECELVDQGGELIDVGSVVTITRLS